jgi:hypothetical protein
MQIRLHAHPSHTICAAFIYPEPGLCRRGTHLPILPLVTTTTAIEVRPSIYTPRAEIRTRRIDASTAL